MSPRTLRVGGWVVDLGTRRLTRGDEERTISTKEAELLRCLADRGGRAVPRAELLQRVWGYAATAQTRTLDVTVARLRRKLDDHPPSALVTERGAGYRLRLDAGDGGSVTPIGRERDRALVARLIEGGAPLVTLLGPPGVGKTTFGRWMAREANVGFVDDAGPHVRARPEGPLLVAAARPLCLPGEHCHVLGPLDPEASVALLRSVLDDAGVVRTAAVDRKLRGVSQALEGHPGLLVAAAEHLAAGPPSRLGLILVAFRPERFAAGVAGDASGPCGDLAALVTTLDAPSLRLLRAAARAPLTWEAADALVGDAATERLQDLFDRSTLRRGPDGYSVPLPLRLVLAATTADASHS